MQLPSTHTGAPAQVSPEAQARASRHSLISMTRRKRQRESSLEELLSTALLSSDTELRSIVSEVDAISDSLKTKTPDLEAQRVATHPAVWSAVRQALLERELRYLALTDDLTCIFNRRGFFAAATQQLRLAQRNEHGLLLFFCDLNNLKAINDQYGHQEGDLALIRTADALEETFRASDVLARIGGDEFAALAVQSSEVSQESIAQRLKKALKAANAGQAKYELSLSVGVARFDPKRAISLGELLAQADEAMYKQKRMRAGSRDSKA